MSRPVTLRVASRAASRSRDAVPARSSERRSAVLQCSLLEAHATRGLSTVRPQEAPAPPERSSAARCSFAACGSWTPLDSSNARASSSSILSHRPVACDVRQQLTAEVRPAPGIGGSNSCLLRASGRIPRRLRATMRTIHRRRDGLRAARSDRDRAEFTAVRGATVTVTGLARGLFDHLTPARPTLRQIIRHTLHLEEPPIPASRAADLRPGRAARAPVPRNTKRRSRAATETTLLSRLRRSRRSHAPPRGSRRDCGAAGRGPVTLLIGGRPRAGVDEFGGHQAPAPSPSAARRAHADAPARRRARSDRARSRRPCGARPRSARADKDRTRPTTRTPTSAR